MAAGRPFPPPRARPVIWGVVDVRVVYAPVFFAGGTCPSFRLILVRLIGPFYEVASEEAEHQIDTWVVDA